jgi:uncharacterized membrane protein YdjX (TVP38/TMEM64 family)
MEDSGAAAARPPESGHSTPKSSWTRLVLVVVAVSAVVAAGILLPVKSYLERLLEFVREIGVWGPVVVGAAYVPACVLFLPGSVLTLGTGFLFGLAVGTVTVSIGSTLGACAAFLVGRTFARDWIARRVAARPKFKAIDDAVAREGFKIVLLTRLSPIFPFNLLNYAFGLTNVSLGRYALASWIGMLPGTIMYVYFGTTLRSLAQVVAGEYEGGAAQTVFFAAGLIVTVVVTVFITRVARRALKRAVAEGAKGPGEHA